MPFNSPLFLFLFLPALLAAYALAPRRLRNAVALVASILFYAWGEPKFVAVVVASSFLDWLAAKRIADCGGAKQARWTLFGGVAANVLVLLYFKYTGFLVTSANSVGALLHLRPMPVPAIALPLGVSFIVFEKITYLVDVYRGNGLLAPSFAQYLLYVLFFPKLLAGPIIKYHEIEKQFTERECTWDSTIDGVLRFSLGLAKKVLIADTLAGTADSAFSTAARGLTPSFAWVGLACFTLQIYFDFSGYSDMAIGLARLLGFSLRENFNDPYISASITEFWRRWHISLSSWIREYLYIPLGGNRRGTVRAYANLVICFFLSGLWHGASWTFVAWGVFHGLFLVCDKLFWLGVAERLPRLVTITLNLAVVMAGWVLFRATSFAAAVSFFAALGGRSAPDPALSYVGNDVVAALLVGAILSFLPLLRPFGKRIAPAGISLAGDLRFAGAAALLILSICRVANAGFNPFLYFRF